MGTAANVLVGDLTSITLDAIAAEDPGGLESASLLPITGFYTTDGVTMVTRSTFADIKVEEVNGTIIRKIIDQELEVTMNIAEGELANLCAAIPGSFINVGGTQVSIGGGDLQAFSMVLVGTGPAAATRTITITRVHPTGEVSTPYKKGEISFVPVSFKAIVSDAGLFATIVDS
jgi:stage V sporulation protein SpoVS